MSEPRKKNPLISGVLSFIFPGVGQFYNEEIWKGLILFAAAIAAIISTVHSGISLGDQMLDGELLPPAGYVVRIVASALILFGLWLYGIIDGVVSAQRISNTPVTVAEGELPQPKSREGLIGLGLVLIIVGVLGFLHQLGLKLGYIIKYGWPVALIILGLYFLLKTTGVIKEGK